jgi:hypothetical protein
VSIFDVKTTYTHERIARHCAALRAKTESDRASATAHYYVFVDMTAPMGHFGRGGDLAHPALSVHGSGADVLWLTDAEIALLDQQRDHTVTREHGNTDER